MMGKVAIGRNEACSAPLAQSEAVAEAVNDLIFHRVQAPLPADLSPQQQVVHTEGQRKDHHGCAHLPGRDLPKPAKALLGRLLPDALALRSLCLSPSDCNTWTFIAVFIMCYSPGTFIAVLSMGVLGLSNPQAAGQICTLIRNRSLVIISKVMRSDPGCNEQTAHSTHKPFHSFQITQHPRPCHNRACCNRHEPFRDCGLRPSHKCSGPSPCSQGNGNAMLDGL